MGIRSRIIVSWPAQLKPSRSPHLAHAIDVFPMIAAATGIDAPKDLPGVNLMDEASVKKRSTVFGVC